MKCGLLGEKLGHSYSPRIHAELADYAYRLYEKSPAELDAFLREGDWDGLNVTIPYKKTVLSYCTALSDRARRIGAVNTLVRLPDGGILGENTDAYGFEKLIARAGIAVEGKKCLVFGSGGARRVPEGMPFAEGFRRLVDITQLIGDVASSYNLSVAIEPLRYKETNMIHTLSEGCALSAMADRPNVGLLADTIHFWDNGEPVYEIRVIRDFMHIHFSSRDRFAPIPEESPLYREFYNALKDSGYDSRISIECGFRDFKAEAAVALSVLKQL